MFRIVCYLKSNRIMMWTFLFLWYMYTCLFKNPYVQKLVQFSIVLSDSWLVRIEGMRKEQTMTPSERKRMRTTWLSRPITSSYPATRPGSTTMPFTPLRGGPFRNSSMERTSRKRQRCKSPKIKILAKITEESFKFVGAQFCGYPLPTNKHL